MEVALLIPTKLSLTTTNASHVPRLHRRNMCQETHHGVCKSLKLHPERGGHAILRQSRLVSATAQPSHGVQPDMAILMEVDGVVADVNHYGHRQSFNAAFQDLGLDCANWTQPVYSDLLRHAGGNEERMLTLFFDQIGWPSLLPTNEKDAFVQKLMQKKQLALDNLIRSGSLPLRPGIESFVDDALEAGVPILFLTAYNKIGEDVARSLIERLGHTRIKRLKILGRKEVESSSYGQLMLGAGSGEEDELATEFTRAVVAEKQRIAEEVASILKLSVEIDTNFTEVSKEVIMLLRAGAEAAKSEIQRCILLAAGDVGVQGATRIGMPCIVVRSSVTARAEFPAARATLEGFGAGAITLSRLLDYLQSG